MKLLALTLAFVPLLAFATPVAEPEPEPMPVEKRSVTCALTGSDVRYHVSPSASSKAPGQFGAKGTKVSFSCYVIGSGSGVPNNDEFWYKVASSKGKGDWVSDYYVSYPCSANIPEC